MSADPAIQDQQSPIEFAHQMLDLSTRHANFTAHRHVLDATGFDPAVLRKIEP
jgi:hypothetical protein